MTEPEIYDLNGKRVWVAGEHGMVGSALVRRLQRERNIGILYTSHNMIDIEEVCDRVIFLHKGKIVAEGSPAEIVKRSTEQSLENVFIKIARSGDLEDANGKEPSA